MTKADWVNAIVALALMAMLTLMGHRVRGNSALFTVGFPVVMWVLWFWMSRAMTARALAKQTESEVVFERPAVLRSLFGFFSGLLALLLVALVQAETYDAALYEKSTGIANSAGDNILMLSFLVASVGLPCLLFLWMAGPYRVLLDLSRCRFQFTQGLPLMTRTKHGLTDGGAFYIAKSRAARHQLRFRPYRHKWGYLLETYDTDGQARTQAHELADKLGVDVERSDAAL